MEIWICGGAFLVAQRPKTVDVIQDVFAVSGDKPSAPALRCFRTLYSKMLAPSQIQIDLFESLLRCDYSFFCDAAPQNCDPFFVFFDPRG